MILFHNAYLVTGEREGDGDLLVDGKKIAGVCFKEKDGNAKLPPVVGEISIPLDKFAEYLSEKFPGLEVIDLGGKCLMAGGIDAHVHFREPGMTEKADIFTESRAAVRGGVTTVMDMPNTKPPTTNPERLKEKINIGKEKSLANIMFHYGVTNDNAAGLKTMLEDGDSATGIGSKDIAGLKVFMGSSTGNMLVDSDEALDMAFSTDKPVLVHCEDEGIIRENLRKAEEKYGDDIPIKEHENIRSRKACIMSSIKALEKAIKYGTHLTLCHISTKEEIEMVRAAKMSNPNINAETSCNYLWFSNEDYDRLGGMMKCNPSIKTVSDRKALREALANGLIDTVGSDHAPHQESEKHGKYRNIPSGIPSVQFTLPVLLTVAEQEEIPLSVITSVFSEKAASIYGLNRGKLKVGWYADLVVFDYDKSFTVMKEDIISKCGWSPYEGVELKGVVECVYIEGTEVFTNTK